MNTIIILSSKYAICLVNKKINIRISYIEYYHLGIIEELFCCSIIHFHFCDFSLSFSSRYNMESELFYMHAADVFEEILRMKAATEDINNLIAVLDDSDDEDCVDDLLLLAEIRKLIELDDESLLLEKFMALFQLVKASTSIFRPYDQNFVTSDGANRVSWSNLHMKYPPRIFRILFRFKFEDLQTLLGALEIPETLNFEGHVTNRLEALLLLLRRMSSACRYVDLAMEFDLLPHFQSVVFNGLCLHIFDKVGPHIRRIDHAWMTERNKLENFARALLEAGCPLENTFGWGDGSHIPVCKPVRGQRPWYCGHHKTHCFKVLVVTAANGLMLCFGPFDGSTHDSLAADIVGLDELLTEHFSFDDGTQFNLFLDMGYRLGANMITPFRNRRDMTQEERVWNRRMCRQRVSVEWSIGKVKNLWKMLTYKKNLKALMSPVATYFFLAVHLTNLHSILYGNEVTIGNVFKLYS